MNRYYSTLLIQCYYLSSLLQCKPLNVITLGQRQSDNINRMIRHYYFGENHPALMSNGMAAIPKMEYVDKCIVAK